MGMNGTLMAVSAASLAQLRAQPEKLAELVMGASLGGLPGLDREGHALLDEMLRESTPGCLFGW